MNWEESPKTGRSSPQFRIKPKNNEKYPDFNRALVFRVRLCTADTMQRQNQVWSSL